MDTYLRIGILVPAILATCSVADAQVAAQTNESEVSIAFADVEFALQLLRIDLVQKELRLTSEQAAKIGPIAKAVAIANEEYNDRDNFKTFQNRLSSARNSLSQIILPNQTARLEEIVWQAYGVRMFNCVQVQRKLVLSPEQQSRINDVLDERQNRRSNERTKLGLDVPHTVTAESDALETEYDRRSVAIDREAFANIARLLSPQQRTQAATLRGKEVDMSKLREALIRRGTTTRG